MTILLLILVVVCLWGLRFPGYDSSYLSLDRANAIKGIFTFLILFSHLSGYVVLSDSWADVPYVRVQEHLGQLIVAMFFFYSGYGIWESFTKKPEYEKHFLGRRLLKILLHFDIAVLLFILVQAFLPVTYPVRNYYLCWIGWEDVGNSNWFIFVILCLYLIAWVAMKLERVFRKGGIVALIILTAGLWGCLWILAGKDRWWVDTMAVFPLGAVVSTQKKRLETLLQRQGVPYLLSALFLLAYFVAHHLWGIDIYGGVACLFCLVVMLFSSWIKVGNPVLAWAGKNAFTIYIIQRLPMIVFSFYGLNMHPALFMMAVIPVTFLLAEGLSRLYKRIDKRIYA